MVGKGILRLTASLALVAAACFGTASLVLAYPPPSCSISQTGGPATMTSGTTASFTFQVLDANGNPDGGQSITFTESGVAGTLNPTSTTTGSDGNAVTAFTAGNSPGQAHITATDSAGGCAGSATVTVGAGGVLGISTGNGSGSGSLPNTSPGAPGPNTALILGLGLAVMVLLGGAVTLRRSRFTQS